MRAEGIGDHRPDVILTDNKKGRVNRSGLRNASAISQDDVGFITWDVGDLLFHKPFVNPQSLGDSVLSLAG